MPCAVKISFNKLNLALAIFKQAAHSFQEEKETNHPKLVFCLYY